VHLGKRTTEIEAVWQRTLNSYGNSNESRVGYCIGLTYPPGLERTNREPAAGRHHRGSDRKVLPLSVRHLAIGFGEAMSEPFVVTENGGERLSDVRRELVVIE
jgi:ectoine hydrolase